MANYTITHPAHTATLERPDHHGVLTAGCRHHNRLGLRSGSETSGIARDVRCCHKLCHRRSLPVLLMRARSQQGGENLLLIPWSGRGRG